MSSFVYLELFFRLSLRFSPHCAQSCVIRPSCMDKKGIKGMPNSFKGLSSPSYLHVKLKTTQFGDFPPRQAGGAKPGKAFSEFACLFISLLGEGATVQVFFFLLLQRRTNKQTKSSKLRIKTTHLNVLVKLTAASSNKKKKKMI